MTRKKKLSKKLLALIITACVAVVLAAAILIINAFIPVKYLSAYLVSADKNEEGEMRVTFLNVGHGDCTLVEFPDGKTMLIDGGNGRFSTNLSVFGLLNSRGVDKIDYLVCTSVRGENCGGLAEVLKYKSVGTVYMPYCINTYITSDYRNFCEQVRSAFQNGAEVKYSEYGEGVFEDGYSFCFLAPSVRSNPEGEYEALNKNPSNSNVSNSSAVMWIECGGTQLLLLGNVLADKQLQLVNAAKQDALEVCGRKIDLRKCNIVKVSNHGDKAAACTELYDFIMPEAAIISVGENARGCPANTVISDVLSRNGQLLRTDFNGTVTVKISGGSREIFKEKE